MPVVVNDVAKTKSAAAKKASQIRKFYKPYYSKVTVKVTKLGALEHKRDSNLKGFSYHISAKLSEAKGRR